MSRRIIYLLFNDGLFRRQVICALERAGTFKELSWRLSESCGDFTISGHSASLLWLPSLARPLRGGSCLRRHRAQWTCGASELRRGGELSAARQALEAAILAPGTQATLDALNDATPRPPHLRTPVSPEVLQHVPRREFELDEPTFNKNLLSARRGAAGRPSGLTTEHLRPLLDDARALHLFFMVAQKLARADVPEAVVDLTRVGRLTSLTKPDGGVRGIVAGDVVRRLVARTISQQLGPEVEQATSPNQYAMSTT